MAVITAGYQPQTISNSSVGFTNIPHGTKYLRVHVQNADVRMQDDGSAAVAGAGGGQLLLQGSYHVFKGADVITDARFIRNASTDAVFDSVYR